LIKLTSFLLYFLSLDLAVEKLYSVKLYSAGPGFVNTVTISKICMLVWAVKNKING